MLSLLVLIRFVSLFGGNDGAVGVVGEKTDAEPWDIEKAESGPMLDLGLSCWDVGRRDNRLIQELPVWDDIESRDPSALLAAATSTGRTYDWRRLTGFGEATCLLEEGG